MAFGILLVALAAGPLSAAPSPPGVAALDHVALYVRDADRSAAFYKDVFGLEQVPAPVPFARWLRLRGGVMLHIVGGRQAPESSSRWQHLALSCDDLTAFIARLDAREISWSDLQGRRVPQSDIRGAGVKQIFIQDPDGYWIEVNDVAASLNPAVREPPVPPAARR